jgi:AcrR family transcriptional regulator
VTMSQIAEKTGICRATLYKYFPDIEAILRARHERQLAAHLQQLTDIRDHAGDPAHRLDAILKAYAFIAHERQRHGTELGALLHGGGHTDHAQQHRQDLLRDLLTECAETGDIRNDAPDELADHCLHA